MNSKSKALQLMALMSIASAQYETTSKKENSFHKSMNDDEKNIKNDLHNKIYEDHFVWTLNKKNADKKAKKLGYI